MVSIRHLLRDCHIYFTLASTSSARCQICYDRIEKGTLKVVAYTVSGREYSAHFIPCFRNRQQYFLKSMYDHLPNLRVEPKRGFDEKEVIRLSFPVGEEELKIKQLLLGVKLIWNTGEVTTLNLDQIPKKFLKQIHKIAGEIEEEA